jgi:hypothetical protein
MTVRGLLFLVYVVLAAVALSMLITALGWK